MCCRGDLLQLKKALDPLDKNPAVDSKTFYQALSKWTEKIRANTEIDEHNTTPRYVVYVLINRMLVRCFFFLDLIR